MNTVYFRSLRKDPHGIRTDPDTTKKDMEMKERIGTIPGDDGWWKSGSMDTYVEIATQLQALGMKEDDIIELLKRLYWAAASCFGG